MPIALNCGMPGDIIQVLFEDNTQGRFVAGNVVNSGEVTVLGDLVFGSQSPIVQIEERNLFRRRRKKAPASCLQSCQYVPYTITKPERFILLPAPDANPGDRYTPAWYSSFQLVIEDQTPDILRSYNFNGVGFGCSAVFDGTGEYETLTQCQAANYNGNFGAFGVADIGAIVGNEPIGMNDPEEDGIFDKNSGFISINVSEPNPLSDFADGFFAISDEVNEAGAYPGIQYKCTGRIATNLSIGGTTWLQADYDNGTSSASTVRDIANIFSSGFFFSSVSGAFPDNPTNIVAFNDGTNAGFTFELGSIYVAGASGISSPTHIVLIQSGSPDRPPGFIEDDFQGGFLNLFVQIQMEKTESDLLATERFYETHIINFHDPEFNPQVIPFEFRVIPAYSWFFMVDNFGVHYTKIGKLWNPSAVFGQREWYQIKRLVFDLSDPGAIAVTQEIFTNPDPVTPFLNNPFSEITDVYLDPEVLSNNCLANSSDNQYRIFRGEEENYDGSRPRVIYQELSIQVKCTGEVIEHKNTGTIASSPD